MSELWKARLLPASFNGIPFKVASHEKSGGRHSVLHEPPDRDSGFTEDIGKKTPDYKIEAYVLGDNYFFNRDALENAMERGGPGILVHPYLGIKLVNASDFSMKESVAEGRIARFSLSFNETGNPFFPFSAIDAVVDFVTTAAAAVLTIQSAFELVYKTAELPGFALESTAAVINGFVDTVLGGFNNVRLDGTQHAVTKRKADELAENASAYVSGNPGDLISAVDDIISDLIPLVPDEPESFTIDSSSGRDDQLSVFRDFIVFEPISFVGVYATPTREQEKVNGNALQDAIQQLAIIRQAQRVVGKVFRSNEEAAEQRRLIGENIEAQLNKDRTDDESFQALEDVNAKLVAAVPNTDSEFSNVKEITRNDSIPTIVLAYDLYEAEDNEQDIIDRNKIRNPSFAYGTLKVLTGTNG